MEAGNNIFGEYRKPEEIISIENKKSKSGKPRLLYMQYYYSYNDKITDEEDVFSYDWWSKLRKYVSSVTVVIDTYNKEKLRCEGKPYEYQEESRKRLLEWSILGNGELPEGSPISTYPKNSNPQGGCDLFIGDPSGWDNFKETYIGRRGYAIAKEYQIPASIISRNNFVDMYNFVRGDYDARVIDKNAMGEY